MPMADLVLMAHLVPMVPMVPMAMAFWNQSGLTLKATWSRPSTVMLVILDQVPMSMPL
jgi:hypothetical protein